jgi:hypothetical protein
MHTFLKRSTGEPLPPASAASLRRRITENFEKKDELPSGLVQDRYSLYEGMTWEKLKAFLEKKFPKSEYPNLVLKEKRVCLCHPRTCETTKPRSGAGSLGARDAGEVDTGKLLVTRRIPFVECELSP